MRRTSKKDGIRTFSSDTDLVDSKRKEIIDRAMRVFVKKGYHRTNMRELADAIGMSVGSIYHYVGSKQDILYLIISMAVTRPEGWTESIAASLETTPARQVLSDFIRMYYTFIDRDPNATSFTYKETRNLDRKSRQTIMDAAAEDVKICEVILKKGVHTGEFKIDNTRLAAHSVIVLGHMWSVRWWFLSQVCTLDEYIKEQTAMILGRILNKAIP